jgi:hypothetical protein
VSALLCSAKTQSPPIAAYCYFADKGELYRIVISRAFNEPSSLLDAKPTKPESAADHWQQIAVLFGNVTTILTRNDRLAELGRGIYREAKAQAAIIDLLELLPTRFERLIESGR